MHFDRSKMNIYFVTIVITAGLLYMAISTYFINENVMGQSSREMLIDQQVDNCYAQKAKEEKLLQVQDRSEGNVLNVR